MDGSRAKEEQQRAKCRFCGKEVAVIDGLLMAHYHPTKTYRRFNRGPALRMQCDGSNRPPE
jgi:hypothetical protein